MEHEKAVEDAKVRSMGYLSDMDWKPTKQSNDQFSIEMKPSKVLSCNILRLRVHADAPIQLCRDTLTLMPGSRRGEWDPDVRDIQFLKQIDDRTVMFCVHTNSVGKGVISAREFVDVARTEESDNQLLLYGCSVAHPAIPSGEKYVRGFNGSWLYKFTKDPSKEGRTYVEVILESEMKGWIPSSVLNSTLPMVFSQALNNWLDFVKKESKA